MKKKNFAWMAAAVLCCGLVAASCEKKEEIVPLNPQEPEQPQEELRTPTSVTVTYQAAADANVVANYAVVGTKTLVRYVDSNGSVKDEAFSGSFSKKVTIPITENGLDAAMQVLIVAKSKEEVEAAQGLDLTTNMSFGIVVNYSDGRMSEAVTFSTPDYCTTHWTQPEGYDHKVYKLFAEDYERYVSRFGGLVPAMIHLGYSAENTDGRISIIGPTMLAGSFWRTHAYGNK